MLLLTPFSLLEDFSLHTFHSLTLNLSFKIYLKHHPLLGSVLQSCNLILASKAPFNKQIIIAHLPLGRDLMHSSFIKHLFSLQTIIFIGLFTFFTFYPHSPLPEPSHCLSSCEVLGARDQNDSEVASALRKLMSYREKRR